MSPNSTSTRFQYQDNPQIHFLHPPGPIVLSAPIPSPQQIAQQTSSLSSAPSTPQKASPENLQSSSSSTPGPAAIPPLFTHSISIRTSVFIHEQGCTPTLEIDIEDPISYHWILFSPSPSPSPSTSSPTPAATVRLVPYAPHLHPPTPTISDTSKKWTDPDYSGSQVWDGREPYVKIGRLATMKGCRGRAYARVLVERAVEFAGRNAGGMVVASERGGVEGKGEYEGEGKGEWRGLVCIHAQTGVKGWYACLGWEVDDGMGRWWEEGIEHVGMWRRVDVLGENGEGGGSGGGM